MWEGKLGKIKNYKNRILRKKNNFLIKYYKIKEKRKFPLIYSLNRLLRLIEIGVVLLIILILMQLLKVINFDWLGNLLKYLPNINKELNRQFLFSQISVTFIILSLFSLIVNLKKEKVLGTSVYRIAFAKSILGNIIFISISIFFFLFINIVQYINDNSSGVILPVFLITLFLLSLLIIKIILYSNSQKFSVNKIISIYNWENTKLIQSPRKSFMSKEAYSKYLYNFNEDTIEKILRKDVEYKRNLYVYERIANLSLFNYKHKVQENYTELRNEPDIIAMWAISIEELIEKELYTDSLIQYNKMINLFIHHEVYISSSKINHLLEQIFISISAIESKIVFEQNKELLLYSLKVTMQYGYYKFNNDFSYTRLGKFDDLLYIQPLYGDFMINYYNLIDKDIDYNEIERSQKVFEYFDSLRIMSLDITSNYYLNEIKYYEVSKELKQYNEELYLVGIPLSNLLILIIQEDMKGRVLYFLNSFNNNSIYIACLIVASRLVSLYFEIKDDLRNAKNIEGYLILIMAKIIELDSNEIRHFSHTIRTTMDIYGHSFLMSNHLESLNIIKQTIIITKKKKVDLQNITFKNKKLGKVVNLFSTQYNSNLLKIEQEKENQKIIDKFGLFTYL